MLINFMKYSYLITKNYHIPNFLIIIFPILIVSGPFLADLALIVVVCYFLLDLYKEKKFEFISNNFFLIFCIFYFYINISSLFSENIFFSLKSSLFYIRFILFSFAIFFYFKKNKKIMNYFFYVFFITYSFVIFDGYVQFILGYDLFGITKPDEFGRLNGIFGNEYILGSYLVRSLFLLLGLIFFYYEKNHFLLICSILIISLSSVLIFLSGERTAFFLLILGFVLLAINNFKYLKYFLNFFLIIFIAIFILANFYPLNKERMFNHVISSMFQDKTNKLIIFSTIHQSHYESAYKMFKSNPVLGIGPNEYRKHCHKIEFKTGKYSCATHPHNSYVQLLAETGILGFLYLMLIFFLLNFFLLKINFFEKKKINHKLSINCFLISFYISLWPLVPSGNFFNNYINIFYYLPFGFFLIFYYEFSKNND